MTSLQPERQAEVTITPRSRTTATLEGRWDDIYATLTNIKNDGRLVPYAQAPVDLADGRVRVEVLLKPAELATPAPPTAPRRARKLPRLSAMAWVRIRWALVAAVGAGALVGVVLGAIALVQAVAALVAMWALPAFVLLVLVAGIGVALGKGYETAPQHVEPDVHPPGFVAPTVRAGAKQKPQTDDLTSRWIARMRNPDSKQAVGSWQDAHGNAKCAISWLLHEANPKGWGSKDSRGTEHKSWHVVNDKYGKRLVNDVIEMNDKGVRLKKIADYVERKVGR
jgi:hypothetical protein